MRKDEQGNECPSTLGEYRLMCSVIGGTTCKAVRFLDEKILESPNGENEEVVAPDSQMRSVLMPMLERID